MIVLMIKIHNLCLYYAVLYSFGMAASVGIQDRGAHRLRVLRLPEGANKNQRQHRRLDQGQYEKDEMISWTDFSDLNTALLEKEFHVSHSFSYKTSPPKPTRPSSYPSASPNQNPSNQTVLRCKDSCDKPTDEIAVPFVFYYSVDIVQDDESFMPQLEELLLITAAEILDCLVPSRERDLHSYFNSRGMILAESNCSDTLAIDSGPFDSHIASCNVSFGGANICYIYKGEMTIMVDNFSSRTNETLVQVLEAIELQMERGDLPELTQDKNLVGVTFLGTILPSTPKLDSQEEEEPIGSLSTPRYEKALSPLVGIVLALSVVSTFAAFIIYRRMRRNETRIGTDEEEDLNDTLSST